MGSFDWQQVLVLTFRGYSHFNYSFLFASLLARRRMKLDLFYTGKVADEIDGKGRGL